MIILDATIVIPPCPRSTGSRFSSRGSPGTERYTLTFGDFCSSGRGPETSWAAAGVRDRHRPVHRDLTDGGPGPSATWLLAGPGRPGLAPHRRPVTLALLQISFAKAPSGPGHRRLQRRAGGAAVSAGARRHAHQLGCRALGTVHQRRHRSGADLPAPRYLPRANDHGRSTWPERPPHPRDDVLVYGFVRAAAAGQPGDRRLFVAGAFLLGAFVLTQMRAEQPIMPAPVLQPSRSGPMRLGSWW